MGDTEKLLPQLATLTFNFISTVAVTLVNKLVLSPQLGFVWPAALSNVHYAITWIGVEMMRICGLFESLHKDDVWAQTERDKGSITGRPRSVRAKPTLRDPEFVAIVAVVGMVTPLNNS